MDDTIVFSDTFDVEEICNRVEQLFKDCILTNNLIEEDIMLSA